MELPGYAKSTLRDRLVRFVCRETCGVTRYGRTSKRDWPFIGTNNDPALYVTCLYCGATQRDSQNWTRVFDPDIDPRHLFDESEGNGPSGA